MIGLIINVLLLMVLAVFVAMNVPYSTSVNLFGYFVENISSVAVILISSVFGVLFSFLFYLAESMRKSKKMRQKKKMQEIKQREKELTQGRQEVKSQETKTSAKQEQAARPEESSLAPLSRNSDDGGTKKTSLFAKMKKKR